MDRSSFRFEIGFGLWRRRDEGIKTPREQADALGVRQKGVQTSCIIWMLFGVAKIKECSLP